MTDFVAMKNKQLLWELLLKNGAFTGHPESNLPRIKKEFEATVTQIDAMYSNLNLIAKNKQFLKIFVNTLNSIKSDVLITAQDISNQRKDEMNERFSSMKNEFDEMIKINRPEEISFSDNKEDGPIKNMDELLKSAVAQRNLVLNDVAPTPPVPEPVSTPVPQSINQASSLDSSPVKPPKTVSFNDKITSSDTEILREILKNQQIIMDRLNNLQPRVQ